MFLLKLLLRLWMIGVHFGLWGSRPEVPMHTAAAHAHASTTAAAPVVAVAARQGRRFTMEDRAVFESAVLGSGRGCGPVNYTYAAVYDGHDGSAVSELLGQQLHTAVKSAVTTAWRSSCSLLQNPGLQNTLTAAAHRVNTAFLSAALKQQQQRHHAGPSTAAPSSSSRSSSEDWDGGSTAVFAVLAGRQLLVGNVGNSRAVLCTAAPYSTSSRLQQAHTLSSSSSTAADGASGSGTGVGNVPQGPGHSSSSSSRPGTALTPMAEPPSGGVSIEAIRAQRRRLASSSSSSSRGGGTAVLQGASASSSSSSSRSTALTAKLPPASCYASPAASSSSSSSINRQLPLLPLLLSSDHTPSRQDEAERVVAAGGFVAAKRPGGKLRVAGELEVSRSFGDLAYVDKGVIATPEFTTTTLQPGDTFLVLASDGIYEVMTAAEVCSHAAAVWQPQAPTAVGPTPPPPPALALPGVTALPAQQPTAAAAAAAAAAAVGDSAPAAAAGGAAAGDVADGDRSEDDPNTAAAAAAAEVPAGAGGVDCYSSDSSSSSSCVPGCCDCSRQQQWLQSVPEAWNAFESRGVWKQRRRAERRRAARMRKHMHAHSRQAAAATAAAAAAGSSGSEQGQGWGGMHSGLCDPDSGEQDERVCVLQQQQQQQQQFRCGAPALEEDMSGIDDSCIPDLGAAAVHDAEHQHHQQQQQQQQDGIIDDFSGDYTEESLFFASTGHTDHGVDHQPGSSPSHQGLGAGLGAPLGGSDDSSSSSSSSSESCCEAGVGPHPSDACLAADHPPTADVSSTAAAAAEGCVGMSPEEECYEELLLDATDDADVTAYDVNDIADISYSYCRQPRGVTAPYTLAQAVAIRIADEAYNRVSMDNIAVVVVDVRQAAAAAGDVDGTVAAQGGKPSAAACQQRQEQRQPPQQQQQQCACMQKAFGPDAAAAAAVRHKPGCAAVLRGVEQHEDTTAAEAAAAAEADKLLPLPSCLVAANVTSSSSGGGAGQQQQQQQASVPSQQASGLVSIVGQGVSLRCNYEQQQQAQGSGVPSAPAAEQPAAADRSDEATEQHLPAPPPAAAERPVGVNNYVLVTRVGRILSRQSNHMHLHPLLGAEELTLQQQQQQQKGGRGKRRGWRWRRRQQQQQLGLVAWSTHSLARHHQPSSLLLQLPDTASSSDPPPAPHLSSSSSSSRENLCLAYVDAGLHHELALLDQQQQLLLQVPGAVGPQYLALPGHTLVGGSNDDSNGGSTAVSELLAAGGSNDGSSGGGSSAQGFLSACLAGSAADPGAAVVQGDGGLSAVVAALAAVPLQQQWLALGAAAEPSAAAAAAAAEAGVKLLQPAEGSQGRGSSDIGSSSSDFGSRSDSGSSDAAVPATVQDDDPHLIEPQWGVLPQQQQQQSEIVPGDLAGAGSGYNASGWGVGLGQAAAASLTVLRAGLVKVTRGGRSLLGLQQRQQHLPLPHVTNTAPDVFHSSQQQHGHASRAAAGDAVAAAAAAAAGGRRVTPPLQLGSSSSSSSSTPGHYKLGKQYGRGSFGEVWAAVRDTTAATAATNAATAAATAAANETAAKDVFVLKRVLGSRGGPVRRSALREAYFGQQLLQRQQWLQQQQQQQWQQQQQQQQGDASGCGSSREVSVEQELEGHRHLVRYVEAFTTKPGWDVWLVFKNEGRSLHNLMYEAVTPDTPPHSSSSTTNNDCSTASHAAADAPEAEAADAAASAAMISVVGPSRWWLAVRQDPVTGHTLVRVLLQQLLQGLAALQAQGISHRDVKPENLLVRELANSSSSSSGSSSSSRGGSGHGSSSSNKDGGGCKLHPLPADLHLRLIDFGSAVDAHSIASGLFGPLGQPQHHSSSSNSSSSSSRSGGPSVDELTMEYAAPEVLFASRYRHPLATGPCTSHAYDMWSTGVVMLELVLGTPAVFAPSPATRAAVDKQLQLKGRPAGERQLLYLLRGLMELCLYPPRVMGSNPAGHTRFSGDSATTVDPTPSGKIRGSRHSTSSNSDSSSSTGSNAALPLPWSCSEESLLRLVASRDPTGRGLEGGLALRLLQRLLAWDPKQRPTAAQVLQHAYFTTPRSSMQPRREAAFEAEAPEGGLQSLKPQQQQQQQRQQLRADRGVADDAQAAAAGQQTDPVKDLLQQQEGVLKECSKVPLGQQGWC